MAVNWDNLNVGRPELDHSERFFEKRHTEHERISTAMRQKTAATKTGKENQKKPTKTVVEFVEETITELKKLTVEPKVLGATNFRVPRVATKVTKTQPAPKPVIKTEKIPEVKQFKARPLPKYLRDRKQQEENKENCVPSTSTAQTGVAKFKAPELKRVAGAVSKPAPKPLLKPALKTVAKPSEPRSVSQVKFDTRKSAPSKPKPLRISTSAPAVPNRIAASRTTTIPTARRTSAGLAVKKFTATVPKYLYREPFKVNLDKKRTIEQKPFQLRMTTRLDQRQKADEERRILVAERKKQAEEEKRKKQEDEIKNLRKTREFKAKPNPFSKGTGGKAKTATN